MIGWLKRLLNRPCTCHGCTGAPEVEHRPGAPPPGLHMWVRDGVAHYRVKTRARGR